MKTYRRTVSLLAGPSIRATRDVYTRVPSDVLRVAALVEISAAAATLARTIVKLRRLDPDLIAPHVADPVDLRAVLGRGRWLHTMTRPVPDPQCLAVDLAALLPAAPVSARRVGARAVPAGQMPLFPSATGGR